MKNKEASFSLTFRHYLRAHPMHTAAFELKDTRGAHSFHLAEWKEAQRNYAMAIESDKGVLLRTPAVAEGMPDYIYLREVPAYVVIKYPTFFVIIPAKKLLKETSKSLTEDRAKQIAT
jgi:hypothetical protein